ncbi:TIGR04438 family Trp-rich protein [Glaciimonas sp. PCH181]|uniref:TIGR04438 family Trp-rich protein n=1 Tax=Glaciimonas sp. PCH181 TaxID=2133943 RepID=UPI000D3A8657|nr:TIGR04438 family Trp-rich protein [Glaciimonas sp. PCH181]PUA17084.1 TIGR04438 family Trp-rich protein [Glaciimonas sp. PCH181]
MPLIIVIVLLVGLKFFAIGPFANFSWWWVALLMVLAVIWFEFGERMLGLDKRNAHDEVDKVRAERVKKTFETTKRPDKK